jgi:para-nitrobenzyl esterase
MRHPHRALMVIVAAALGACRTAAPPAAAVSPTLVQTTGGALEGRLLDGGVKAWLGVPFATPPVRERRWREAEPAAWQGTFHADRKMPACIQVLRPHDINHYFGEEATSEDCLYMNVWAPPQATAESKLPVIVFLYGGGGTVGSSGMANYDGAVVAGRGAVYVNFNYRLGILGFMAHPELTTEQGGHSGNYGYLDQQLALAWIQKNIAAFGGDPAKVIVTGQSAGAGSVVQQIFSPKSKGLFRGAVMFSGCNYTSSNAPLAEAEATGLEVQNLLAAASLDEMRQVPADQILAIQNEFQLGRRVAGVRTGGVIDGYFMPGTKDAILAAGGAADVPIIASFTHDEANIALKGTKTAAEYGTKAREVFGAAAAEFLSLYPVADDGAVATAAQSAANDAAGLLNSRTCAELQAQHHRSASYITVFSRKHPYVPGVKIADQDPATIGAYHTAEVPYYFGTQDAYNLFRPTRAWAAWDRELSETLTASLIAFANTGNPSTPKVEWPAWSASEERYVEFGDTIRPLAIDARRMAFMARHRPAPAPPGGPRRFPRD